MTKKLIFFSTIILFLSIQFATTAWNKGYSTGITTSDKIYKRAEKLKATDYPNANSIIVNDLTIESYKPDGTGTAWNDCSVKIFTEKGKRENRTYNIPFSADYSKVKITLAEIISKNGKVEKINIPEQSKTTIASSQMASNIFNPNSKVISLNVPGLKIGDTFRIVTCTDNFKNPIPNTWSNLVTFEGTAPIYHQSYTVKAPHSLPLKKTAVLDRVEDTLNFSKNETLKGITYRWEAENVPRMFPEPQMPALSSVVQRVAVSTIPSWGYISKWYWNLCKPHMETSTPEMKEKAHELIKNSVNDSSRIKNIFDFVSQKIRYMGLIAEKKAPGMEPHDVKLTFNNRYGVCRDKAVLLAEMLRLAGFKAFPVLIKVGPKLDKEVPMAWFNHAITCVKLGDKTILMDPTNENTKEIFPAYLSNLSYIIADPEENKLHTSSVIPAGKNMMNIKTSGTLDKKGVLTATTVIRCRGINDTIYRNFLSRRTPAQLEQLFDKVFRYIIPSSEIIKLDIHPENLQNTNEEIKLVIKFTSNNELVKGKTKAMLDLPWIGKSLGFVKQVTQAAGLEKRKYPLVTSFTCGYKETIKIKLNNSRLKLSHVPEYKAVNSKILTCSRNVNVKNNRFTGKSMLKVKKVEFTPKEYLQLKSYLKELEVNNRKKIIFNIPPVKKVKEKSDSVILNKTAKLKLKNKHCWQEEYKIERKILTYNGKKEYSEIKIPYNPAWEKISIKDAEVINKSGKISRLTENEINIMDASWNSTAPRYPGGKIFVANLPSVDIGSVIKYTLIKKVKGRPFFSTAFSFQTFSPVKKLKTVLEYPENLDLKLYKMKTDNIKEIKSTEQSTAKYTWSAEDIPAVKKVSSLPPKWTFLPTIIVSTGSWENYTAAVKKKLSKNAQNTTKIKHVAHSLIKDKKTEKEKIKAVKNYIAENIRRAGPSFTSMPLSAISKADTTLKDGYGNSADCAVLLYSMLKSLGFEPEFVLASNIPYLQEILTPVKETPLRSLLKDVLIKVSLSESETVFLNDTDEYAALGTTAHQGRTGYDLNMDKFFKIKALKNKADKMEVFYNLEVSGNGCANLSVMKKYYGNNYSLKKKKFARMRPEDRNRYYQRRIANISQLAVPTAELYTNFKKYPGIEKYSAKISSYAIPENNYFHFALPLRFKFILNLDANKRELPFFLSNARNIDFYITTKLPNNYTDILIHPETNIFTLPDNSGIISVKSTKIDNTTYKNNILINTKPAIYSKEAYREAVRINKLITSPETKTFLLKKK